MVLIIGKFSSLVWGHSVYFRFSTSLYLENGWSYSEMGENLCGQSMHLEFFDNVISRKWLAVKQKDWSWKVHVGIQCISIPDRYVFQGQSEIIRCISNFFLTLRHGKACRPGPWSSCFVYLNMRPYRSKNVKSSSFKSLSFFFQTTPEFPSWWTSHKSIVSDFLKFWTSDFSYILLLFFFSFSLNMEPCGNKHLKTLLSLNNFLLNGLPKTTFRVFKILSFRFLALSEYVSRAHEIEIRPSSAVRPSIVSPLSLYLIQNTLVQVQINKPNLPIQQLLAIIGACPPERWLQINAVKSSLSLARDLN